MSEILAICENLTKGVKRMIRNLFLLFVFFVLVLIIAVIAFHEGWVTIVIDPNGKNHEIRNNGIYNEESAIFDQKIEELFRDNDLFDLLNHVVEPGETLFDLENKYGTSWKVIRKMNHIENPLQLPAGNVIRVPVRNVDS